MPYVPTPFAVYVPYETQIVLFEGFMPIESMYSIFTHICICHKFQPNVGKYAIHGWYGM